MLYSRFTLAVKKKMKGMLIFCLHSLLVGLYSTSHSANPHLESEAWSLPCGKIRSGNTQNGMFACRNQYLRYDEVSLDSLQVPWRELRWDRYGMFVRSIAYENSLYSREEEIKRVAIRHKY
jgi:hypothetical protein